jgi:hypothetical protein
MGKQIVSPILDGQMLWSFVKLYITFKSLFFMCIEHLKDKLQIFNMWLENS